MPKVLPQKAGDPILTRSLPARCPKCGKRHPAREYLGSGISRLSCPCGWTEKYQMEAE